MKTTDKTHRFYEIIRRVVCGMWRPYTEFKILADRPLNHGHLVVCRVWLCRRGNRRIREREYRFVIDEANKVNTLDYTSLYFGMRGPTTRGCNYRKQRESLKVYG